MERIDLNPEIVQRLMADYAMTEHGEYLRGRCPECDKKTLWTWRNKPVLLNQWRRQALFPAWIAMAVDVFWGLSHE